MDKGSRPRRIGARLTVQGNDETISTLTIRPRRNDGDAKRKTRP